MTTETRQRIRAYKRMLPDLRERVIAVALLLAMSASMLGTASYAWLTLSKSPEIRGMNSTVAANGNLEIALATGDGSKTPDESEVGDSSAYQDQTLTGANITWGNLVNLADPSYGLENLILRPAQLNENNLLNSPLSSAAYTKDGRVEKLTTSFKYTSWIIPEEDDEVPYFGLAQGLGVRAVSSTKISANSFEGKVENMIQEVEGLNTTARSKFVGITDNQDWMKSLANMMTVHMNANLNGEAEYKNAEVSMTDVQNLVDMYIDFESAFDAELNAMTELVNLQLYLAHGGDETKYVKKTKDDILNGITNIKSTGTRDYIAATVTADNGTEKVVKITNLENFLYNYNMLKTDRADLEKILAAGNYKWVDSGLNKIVQHLVNIDNCQLKFENDPAKTVSDFVKEFSSAGALDLLSLVSKYSGKQCNAIITNGVLYEFEKRVGSHIEVKDTSKNSGLELTAKMYVSSMSREFSASVYATITTSASEPYTFASDLDHARSMNTGAGLGVGDVTAMDTYGLVIDLWARTNANDSYLMLEGNVLTQSKEQVTQVRDKDGQLTDLYALHRVVTMQLEDGSTYTYEEDVDLYQKTENGTVVWYRANTYQVFELLEGETPQKKVETVYEVIGYEGENRVWTEEVNPLLTTDATTQGSGSCYVFYADNPQDQTQSRELLRAMRVAFIDGDGKLLAIAKMDPDQSYEEAGRVTVPLVMDSYGVVLGEDKDGKIIRAITAMDANVPKRITALVYLDGSVIANEHVMAASDIQGQLNIQFGSSAELMAVKDTELEAEIRRVRATVDKTEFDFDTATDDMTTNVTLSVEGSAPSTVTASFVRKINATQGSREGTMVFQNNGDGIWTSSYTFLAPGEYELRTVRVDGVDIDLFGDLPLVTVEGFGLEYINCDEGKNVFYMTGANSYAVHLNLKFSSTDMTKIPRSVVGYYVRDLDGYQTDVRFTMDSSQVWHGTANFQLSGDYTLRYLELDGEYYNLDPSNYQNAEVFLGMKAEIWTTSISDPEYLIIDNETPEEDKVLRMKVKMLDNEDHEKMDLETIRLVYKQVNGAKSMDGDLKWNPATKFYEGELPIEFGRYRFDRVLVGDSEIRVASRAPSFTILSPDPAEYVGFAKQGAVYAPNGDASLNIRMTNAANATIWALIEDQTGATYEVICNADVATEIEDGTYQYNIPVPTNNGTQDGTWKLLEVKIWDIFGENGHEYTEDAPYFLDLRNQNNSVRVTQRILISFPEQNKSFSGSFMQTHTISGVNVVIQDGKFSMVDVDGDGKSDVSEVAITYKYNGDSLEKGGYTGDAATAQDDIFILELSSTDGKNFVQSKDQTVALAGTYVPTDFSFKIYNGTTTETKIYTSGTANWPANVPTITVSSTTPAVEITKTTDYSGSTHTATSATVNANIGTKTSGCNEVMDVDQPTVTITLTGFGYAKNVSLSFGDTAAVFAEEGGTQTCPFEWTADSSTECTRYIGRYEESGSGDSFTAAGKLTTKTLILTDNNGKSYTVTLDSEIVIDNQE